MISRRYAEKKKAILDVVECYRSLRLGTEDGVDMVVLEQNIDSIVNDQSNEVTGQNFDLRFLEILSILKEWYEKHIFEIDGQVRCLQENRKHPQLLFNRLEEKKDYCSNIGIS